MDLRELRRIYKDPRGEEELLIAQALGLLCDQVKDDLVALPSTREITLALATRDVDLRWRKLERRLRFRCPHCLSVLQPSPCGRFECRTCDAVLMLKLQPLHEICKTCVSYKTSCTGCMESKEKAPLVSTRGVRSRELTFIAKGGCQSEGKQ